MLNDVGCTQEAPPSGCPASSCFPHNSIQSISLLRHHHFYRSGRNERLSHLNPLHTQQIVSRPRLQGGYILFCHWSDFFWRNSHRRFNLSFFFFFLSFFSSTLVSSPGLFHIFFWARGITRWIRSFSRQALATTPATPRKVAVTVLVPVRPVAKRCDKLG